jgi:hypothetical protein
MMTLIQDTQRDASQQAIARWENEGGALTSFPAKNSRESAERLARSSGSSRPIGRNHDDSRVSDPIILGQPER